MKNITFSADDGLIDLARKKAQRENRTLNEAFRDWLAGYAGKQNRVTVEEVRHKWKQIKPGGPYSRDEMNERR